MHVSCLSLIFQFQALQFFTTSYFVLPIASLVVFHNIMNCNDIIDRCTRDVSHKMHVKRQFSYHSVKEENQTKMRTEAQTQNTSLRGGNCLCMTFILFFKEKNEICSSERHYYSIDKQLASFFPTVIKTRVSKKKNTS